jgi:hypothetical protein
MPSFKSARFHILTGPSSLFDRIKFIMNKPRELKLNANHFNKRALERNAPIEEIKVLNPKTWKLIIAEVRTDTGKFVSSTWEIVVNEKKWWIVIGLHDTIKTIIRISPGKVGFGDGIVTNGDSYRKVERVNLDLMEIDNKQ